MAFVSTLTPLLRLAAAVFWSLGLACVAFDRIYLFSAEDENVKIAYLFFSLAGLACAAAEKREFGTRVFLYRLHAIATSGPWHYLLLYFLWVNLFAPFTENPVRSVIYACAGWFSLVVVAFSAQLIFCDRRSGRGIALLPANLRIAFLTYNLSVIALAYSYLFARLFPEWNLEPLFVNAVDACLYFVAGFPFLVWDFVNPKRQLLPRALVAISTVGMIASVFLMRQWIFLAAAASAPAALLALGIYKRIRLQRALASLALLCLFSVNGVFLYTRIPATNPTRELIDSRIDARLTEVEEKLRGRVPDFRQAWDKLVASHFLGGGVGSSGVTRGVWLQILAEVGVVGLALYLAFFGSLLRRLFTVRHAQQLVVSNVALISTGIFLVFLSHYPRNPYGTGIWVWYSLWAAFGSTRWKREEPLVVLAKVKQLRGA